RSGMSSHGQRTCRRPRGDCAGGAGRRTHWLAEGEVGPPPCGYVGEAAAISLADEGHPHAEATGGVDLQVPAILAYLERNGLKLAGNEVVDIGTWQGGSSHPCGAEKSPSIPPQSRAETSEIRRTGGESCGLGSRRKCMETKEICCFLRERQGMVFFWAMRLSIRWLRVRVPSPSLDVTLAESLT